MTTIDDSEQVARHTVRRRRLAPFDFARAEAAVRELLLAIGEDPTARGCRTRLVSPRPMRRCCRAVHRSE